MNKIAPAIVTLSLCSAANALILNGENIVFKTQVPNVKVCKTVGKKGVRLMKFKKPLAPQDLVKYFDEGIESIEYAGDLAYYFYGDLSVIDSLLFKEMKFGGVSSNNLSGYASLPLSAKVSKELLYSDKLEDTLLLNLSLFLEVDEETFKDNFSNLHIELVSIRNDGKNVVVRIPKSELKTLISNPLVKYVERKINVVKIIDGVDKYPSKKRNLTSANMMHVEELWNSPYSLNGKGVKVGVVDGGSVRKTHREFMINGISRVKLLSPNSSLSRHATHVSGTIGALGLNPLAHGMANDVEIYSYYFLDAYFSAATYNLYKDYDIKLTNHSYGYAERIRLGEYDSEAAAQDDNIYKHPEIIQFLAAGNDRGADGYANYGITKGPVNSKNIFTIGALKDDKQIAYFSSTGPVDDGRVKPDLVADGWSVYSCDSKSDDAYANMFGTSMATPGATGAAALIMQAYKDITGKDITADILKAVLFNTAEDLGREGPDYEYGYGLIDAKKAVDLIKSLNSSSPLLYTDAVSNGEEKILNFYSDGKSDIKITVSWIDPAGNAANKSKNLVNDIDIKVIGGGKVYYPFTLDKNNPELPAASDKPNHTDNSEQIVIKSPKKGEYTLIIRGGLIVTSSQKFAIASNIPLSSESSSVLDVDSSKVSFQNVNVGSRSSIEEITLKNVGSKELAVYNISLSDKENFGLDFKVEGGCPDTFPFVLEASKKCNIGVYASPKKEGVIEGYLDIDNDSSNDSQKRVSLKVKAIDSLPVLHLYHTLNFDFDSNNDLIDKDSGWTIENGFLRSKKIGNGQSTDYKLKVKVYDNAKLSFRYDISSELDYDLFRFYINSSEILNDSGIKKNVSFSQYLTKGDYIFDWRYSKDYEVSLGKDALFIDDIEITNAVFDSFSFDPTAVGDSSDPEVLYVENAGEEALKIDNISLSDKEDFKIDFTGGLRPCKSERFTLLPKEYCTFSLLFTPKSKGSKSSVLKIESNDKKAKREYLLKGEAKSKESVKKERYFDFAKFIYNIVNEISSFSDEGDSEIDDLARKLSQGDSAYEAVKDLIFKPEVLYKLSDEKYVLMLLKIIKKDGDEALFNYYLEKLKSRAISRKLLADEIFLKNASWSLICEKNSLKAFDRDDMIEAFIERFYNFALKRESDKGGMEYWKEALKSKKKNAIEIGIYFFLSPEFKAKNLKEEEVVTMLYRTFLGREPDSGGLKYWVDRAKNGLSRRDMIAGFAYSKEFSQIASKYGLEAH